MTVGIPRVDIFIGESNSLKAKRMVVHSLKSRLRNHFNIAVTQIDTEDKWQKARLAIAAVEKDRRRANSVLSGAVNFLEGVGQVFLIDNEMELI